MKDVSLMYYKDVISRNVNWLWYPYIPFGKITIVQGDPGEGKTTFILRITVYLYSRIQIKISKRKRPLREV